MADIHAQPMLLVFTDLDGTLLDHYSYRADDAKDGLALLAKSQTPVIFNTSKTLPECLTLARDLQLYYPFIVENGSAICIPQSPTNAELLKIANSEYPLTSDTSNGTSNLVLGASYTTISHQLSTLAKNFRFLSLSDSSIDDICKATGLTPEQASRARQRQYSEPLLWLDSQEKLSHFRAELADEGLTLLRGGRFYHVLGQTDKGHALRVLRDLYRQTPGYLGKQTRTVALGDSHNDLAMLQAADIAVLIRSPAHPLPDYPSDIPPIISTRAGPGGWSESIRFIAGDQ